MLLKALESSRELSKAGDGDGDCDGDGDSDRDGNGSALLTGSMVMALSDVCLPFKMSF